MDDKTLQTLEYFKILERLAARTAFSASRERALALRPTDRLEQAFDWQAETTEAVTFLTTRPDMTIGGARDIRAAVELAYRSGVLQPSDLLDIKSTLIAARTLGRTFEHLQHQFPRLYDWASQLHPPTGLVEAITRAIDERGQILDSASSKLAQVRRDMRIAHDRLMTKLQRMLTDSSSSSLLQEAIITQRDGRYVIPLRSEFKGRIKSIVHDQSASGATLFVEPLAVVELNNAYRELQLAERDEERRILAELSAHVADNAELLLHMLNVIAEIDFILARAKYAEDLYASEPLLKAIGKPRELGKVEPISKPENQQISESANQQAAIIRHPGTTINLIEARHPLLDRDTVVPIDVELDPHTFVMVVTGPNTGGKTVSLKTIGLLVLMAQSGLHIPAHSGSELTIFKNIYADIGDEQSIEQSLSTFSGHVKNIIRILKRADRHSLVILDELGAGTDPQEGAALARALLSHLLREGVTTLVTTHHPELKAYAHGAPGAVNASVEFDLKTLRPTYRLTIGLPGRSNALAIAKRLGLPDEIIEDARSELNPDDLRAESMLDEIHHQRDAARKARGNADRERHQAEKMRSELVAHLDKIEDERRAILEKTRQEAEAQMEALQAEISGLRRELTRARQPLDAIKLVEEKSQELAEEATAAIETPFPRPIASAGKPPSNAKSSARSAQTLRPLTLAVGSKVHLRTLNTKGIITSLGTDEAEVQVGMLRIRTRLADLQPTGGESASESPTHPVSESTSHASPLTTSPGLELDLRGQTAEEALDKLDRYLESAYLSGLPWVRIIHGKGTGKLRVAVRDALQHHPHVKSFETGGDKEGGDGVTVAKLHAG